ncbi:histidinol dehydrogenase [Paenibacillus aurantiacus]|uniref:Histidinol dehydrogenase n=1 Tax=Paenibacillus aurantiacus TaxID=1936118 RepID=A0ABV5L0Q4_9BACL
MRSQTITYRLPEQQEALIQRFQKHKTLFNRELMNDILAIFNEVGLNGDEAVKRFTQQFDQVSLDTIVLADAFVQECIDSLAPDLRAAIDRAIHNVREVNLAKIPQSWTQEIRPGTIIGEHVHPLDAVGLWIPARKGPLVSTAIMLVAAAKAAGVKKIVVGMPPLQDSYGDPGTIAAAKLAGADLFVVGNGVSVIAGFAQGTASIPEVDGIFGPGPGGIAASMGVAMTFGKKSVLGIGPTECVVFADETADPWRTAHDLINEAEHGPDSTSVLVTTSARFAERVEAALWQCIDEIDGVRRQYLQSVFDSAGKGAIVVTASLEQAAEFINWFAPEHLMVVCSEQNEARFVELIHNAGEILIGPDTPFSAANYGIGITAVLPTNHFARTFSGVTAKDMVKFSTIGKLSNQALREIYPIIKELGEYESLPAHVRAAQIRVE